MKIVKILFCAVLTVSISTCFSTVSMGKTPDKVIPANSAAMNPDVPAEAGKSFLASIDYKIFVFPKNNIDPKMLIPGNPDIDPHFLIKPEPSE